MKHRLAVEVLEPRILLSSYTFTAHGEDDVISVEKIDASTNRISGTSDGDAFDPVTFTGVDTLTIDAGGGNDVVRIEDEIVGASDYEVDLGSGDDLLQVEETSGSDLTNVTGGGGQDSVQLYIGDGNYSYDAGTITDDTDSWSANYDGTVDSALVKLDSGAQTLYSQDFEGASLNDWTDEETDTGTDMWNTLAGSGLDVSNGDKDDFPGNSDTSTYAEEWKGFNVATTQFWENTDSGEGRGGVFPDSNIIAVADSDEFADGDGSDDSEEEQDEFNVFLRTPSIDVQGYDLSTLQLTLDSSYANEGDETATINVYSGGSLEGSVTVSDDGHTDADSLSYTAGDFGLDGNETSVVVEFAYENADDDYWWAIDNVEVSAERDLSVDGALKDDIVGRLRDQAGFFHWLQTEDVDFDEDDMPSRFRRDLPFLGVPVTDSADGEVVFDRLANNLSAESISTGDDLYDFFNGWSASGIGSDFLLGDNGLNGSLGADTGPMILEDPSDPGQAAGVSLDLNVTAESPSNDI